MGRFNKFQGPLESVIGKAFASSLVIELNKLGDSVERDAIQTRVNIAGGDGGTVGDSETQPGGGVVGELVKANTNRAWQKGRLVNYGGTMLDYADAKAGLAATHVVVESRSGVVILSRYAENAFLDIEPSSTIDSNGRGSLFLATNGRVTRNQFDITNSYGTFLNGYVMKQEVGVWQGLSQSNGMPGQIKATVDLYGGLR